jgi:hypothetical protein
VPSSPLSKIFPLALTGKSALEARPSRARKEGRIAIVTDVGRGMRWTRKVHETNAPDADDEAVWSWRLDAGVKFAKRSQATVTKSPIAGESAE